MSSYTELKKMRKEFLLEQSLIYKSREVCDCSTKKRKATPNDGDELASLMRKGLGIETYEEKLQRTIRKACVKIPRHTTILLTEIPKPATVAVKEPTATPSVSICQARNLNGTPCKFKAKCGKFCAKHAS